MKHLKPYLLFVVLLAVSFAGAYRLALHVLQADPEEKPAQVHLYVNQHPSLDEVLVNFGLSDCPVEPSTLCEKKPLIVPTDNPDDDGVTKL